MFHQIAYREGPTVLADDGTIDIADSENFAALFGEERSGVRTDVAETLQYHSQPSQGTTTILHMLGEDMHHSASSRLLASRAASEFHRFAGPQAGE